ncbi:hypothetical protein CYD26_04080 [Pseudomonas sp. FFUP_PS_473]|jgi:hypothetical protein|uniref:hypothetical protein n=1 Tax=Pseudomonas TaxID=286 RepID=UPI0008112895|nr:MULTISPECIES: hypothetical protein [Pseudomonas]ATR81767.1 hypothetical protein CS390_04015 [Pseudomonas sp. HLS-6]MEE3632726.1 hypothetical protein [Pseudomonas sp. AL 58]PLP95406.1 hypothetical protein CYD26_04080 [Pseudomonas sp. FFUP_PS_473]WJM98225.1 hypothetical protein QEP73_08910 [Pseudomonas defluvii]
MSLQMLWGLMAAHPAKLINVLALLLTCPGSFLLHGARRREARALAERPAGEAVLDVTTVRVNRFYYALGFAFLAMALLLSWVSTWA